MAQKNRRKFTDISVRRLPEGMHWDESTPAFGLRVGKRARTFIAVKTHGVVKTIGRYPSISLQDARLAAKAFLIAKHEKVRPEGYSDLIERFLQQSDLRERTRYEYGLMLRRFSFPSMGVSGSEIHRALETIEKPSARAHHFTVLRIFFNWAVRHDYIDSNPMAKLRKPKVQSPRERVLTDVELVKIWNACHHLGKYGALVRLLMVTGQRKGQFANLRDEWIDHSAKLITFPAAVMKTNKEHRLPFAYPTDFILARCGHYKGYYFSPVSALGQPFTAWSKSKLRLDGLIDIDPWTLHDLRRTWSTNAARLEIPPHIAERVLSHTAPEGRVASIYNRYRYEDEMRAAQDKMGKFILTLVQEAGADDPLRRRLEDFA